MSESQGSRTTDVANGLVAGLRASTVEWESAIRDCPDDAFNATHADRWSPAQILMHLVMTEKSINGVLAGPSERVDENRKPVHDRMERGLTDATRKLNAPKFLEPRAERYDKQRLIDKLKSNRDALEQILSNASDMDNLFTSFPHPYFGLLTGYEWARNVLLHANRHLAQFRNTIDAFTANGSGS